MNLRRVVLGTAPFAGRAPRHLFDVLDRFAGAGGELVDTATFYGDGQVQRQLGTWLRATGFPVAVQTKIGREPDAVPERVGELVRSELDRACTALGAVPQRVLLHDVDRTRPALQAPAWRHLSVAAAEYGITCGVSGNDADALGAVASRLAIRRVMVAKQYDLLWRNAAALLDRPDVEVLLAAPFHQGALLAPSRLAEQSQREGDPHLAAQARRLDELCRSYDVPVRTCAIGFVHAETRASAMAVGVRTTGELDDLLDDLRTPLPAELLTELRALGLCRPARVGPLDDHGLPRSSNAHLTEVAIT